MTEWNGGGMEWGKEWKWSDFEILIVKNQCPWHRLTDALSLAWRAAVCSKGNVNWIWCHVRWNKPDTCYGTMSGADLHNVVIELLHGWGNAGSRMKWTERTNELNENVLFFDVGRDVMSGGSFKFMTATFWLLTGIILKLPVCRDGER